MKIEIDTANMSKDEMKHLASMLSSLAGESGVIVPAAGSSSQTSTSEAPVASGGLFSLFDDNPKPEQPAETYSAQPETASTVSSSSEPVTQQSGGDLFSLFGDDSNKSVQSAENNTSVVSDDWINSSVAAAAEEPEETKKPSTAQDMLDDDRLIPY